MHCVPENTDIRCCSFHIYQLILIIQEYGVRWEIKMPFDSLFSLQCFCQRLAESDDLHTHTRAQQPFFRDYPYPGWAGTRKVKPIWIFLKQETVSGMSWAVCKSAPRSRQITTPATHHSVFYRPNALSDAQPTASKHWMVNWMIYVEAIASDMSVVLGGDIV